MAAVITLNHAVEAMVVVSPPGTVHVAVVDPGVGTGRRGLVVAASGRLFVGPDNGLFSPGLFSPVLSGSGWRAFELRAAEYRRLPVSAAFHGRDVFAPTTGRRCGKSRAGWRDR